ncbi:MAG TPA: hypothetical protein DGT21_18875 [Armatimonadetes bacterium]|jgi:hypothetical protein|nr:hypothetical protein [Armatimonadota bacterium]
MVALWRAGDWEVHCDTDGGRLDRVLWRGHGLLTGPHLPGGVFTPPSVHWGLYETRPVFGYDDCWPSLDPSPWPGLGRDVRDHGELCWHEWEISPAPDALTCAVSAADGAWSFRRVISVRDGALQMDFTCGNGGSLPMPMTWAGHALVPPAAVRGLTLPECDRITLDYTTPMITQGDAPRRALDVWPYLQALPVGEAVMLVLHETATPVMSIDIGGMRWRCVLEGISRPALGLWYNRRGYPVEGDLAREEFGIEWMLTGPTRLQDAVEAGTAVTVPPGESLRWSLQWKVSAGG